MDWGYLKKVPDVFAQYFVKLKEDKICPSDFSTSLSMEILKYKWGVSRLLFEVNIDKWDKLWANVVNLHNTDGGI